MSLKKIKIISFFIVVALAFIFHFLYEWLPNPLFSVLFPVNESIWEHMKLLYSGFIIWGVFEYIILKKNDIKVNNYFLNLFIISVSSIMVYLIIYIPLHKLFGEVMFINIALLILVIALFEYISYKLLLCKNSFNFFNIISLVLIVLFYVLFGYLTYNPPKNYLFYDTHHNRYGINIKE